MKKSILIIFVFLSAIHLSFGQKTIEDQSKKIVRYLEYWLIRETDLWETTSWWNAANILTRTNNPADLTKHTEFRYKIEDIFNKTKEFEVVTA